MYMYGNNLIIHAHNMSCCLSYFYYFFVRFGHPFIILKMQSVHPCLLVKIGQHLQGINTWSLVPVVMGSIPGSGHFSQIVFSHVSINTKHAKKIRNTRIKSFVHATSKTQKPRKDRSSNYYTCTCKYINQSYNNRVSYMLEKYI